jgi:hypothetical protein
MKERSHVPAAMARQLLEERRERDAALGADMFADPSWELLLHLFAASDDGAAIPVCDLCEASSAPAPTALRWIKALAGSGKVVLVRHLSNPERPFVQLTPAVYQQMRHLLESWAGRSAARRKGA